MTCHECLNFNSEAYVCEASNRWVADPQADEYCANGTQVAYKLVRKRKDGTLGPLFINARLRMPIGEWMDAEDHQCRMEIYANSFIGGMGI